MYMGVVWICIRKMNISLTNFCELVSATRFRAATTYQCSSTKRSRAASFIAAADRAWTSALLLPYMMLELRLEASLASKELCFSFLFHCSFAFSTSCVAFFRFEILCELYRHSQLTILCTRWRGNHDAGFRYGESRSRNGCPTPGRAERRPRNKRMMIR